MNKRQKKFVCSLVGSIMLLGGQAAAADETASEYNFDEYVVTANRIPVQKSQIAANVTVITRENIEKGGFANVPDILRKNNVDMERYGATNVPVLNGDDRVLVLIDGRRMNWSHLVVSGSDHAGVVLDLVPVENIERIEIVRGPASSLYGSDAVGGIINIITRKGNTTQTSIATEFGSWGFERYNVSTQGKNGDISFFVAAEKKHQGNYEYKDAKTGQTKEHPDSYKNQDNVTMRLDKELSDDRSLSLQFEHIDNKAGFAGYLKADGTSYYPGGYWTSKDDNVALTYQWAKAAGAGNSLRVYHNQYQTINYNSLDSTYNLAANGVDWQQSWKLGEKHTLVGGAEWRQEKLDDHVSINQAFTTEAVFAEDRWKLPGNWTLSLGTRYDDHSVSGGHVTSRVTANREINAKTNLFASWGQYIKNPTIAQMYSNTQWWKGNPALRPETGETVTVGFNTELAEGTKLQASVYHSKIKDAIDWEWKDWDNTGSEYTKYINVDNQKRQGFDLTVSRQLSPLWTVSGGYSYVKIQNRANTATSYANDPRNSQPNAYHLDLEYDHDKWNSSLTLWRATGRDLTRFTAKAYTTVDMIINYQVEKDTRIFLKGYNLTNAAYETTGTYWSGIPGEYPMPGRSIYAGVEHKF